MQLQFYFLHLKEILPFISYQENNKKKCFLILFLDQCTMTIKKACTMDLTLQCLLLWLQFTSCVQWKQKCVFMDTWALDLLRNLYFIVMLVIHENCDWHCYIWYPAQVCLHMELWSQKLSPTKLCTHAFFYYNVIATYRTWTNFRCVGLRLIWDYHNDQV